MIRPPTRPPLFPYTTLFRSPGDYLAAGWSFQIPGSHPQANVTIQYGQVILQVGCESGATPSPSEITVPLASGYPQRSEEHTSELQSRFEIVCRLLLEKKKHH